MLKQCEAYIIDVMRGKRQGIVAAFVGMVLLVLSWMFRGVVSCRNWAYDRGWLKRYYPPVPVVISIGNIVAGGTGKTPVTLMLAKEFYSRHQLAILSRGYRSSVEGLFQPIALCTGQGPLFPAAYCGDEPYLLAKNLPQAFVFVGKNRHLASHMAAKAGAELILLDDGMQHRKLARDYEVVVMDAHDPFGQDHFLPRGFLRENPTALSRADLVIFNNVRDLKGFDGMKKKVSSYTKAPVIATMLEVDNIQDQQGNVVPSLKERRVGIFCGIAQPDNFKATVLGLGAEVMGSFCVGDHENVGSEELAEFAAKCRARGAEFIVCTEKDWVKRDPAVTLALPILWMQMKLTILEGKSEWQSFIGKAAARLA